MEWNIRQADASEAERLTDHRMQFMREMFGKDSSEEFRRSTLDYFRKHLADGTCIVHLIEDGGAIVSIAVLCLYEYMPRHNNTTGRVGYVNNVYTAPAHRGKGISEKVMRSIVVAGRKAGANELYLHSQLESFTLYKRVGFEMTTQDMVLQLE